MANNVEGGQSGMRERSRREFLTAVAALGVTATVSRNSLLTEDAAHVAHNKAKTLRNYVLQSGRSRCHSHQSLGQQGQRGILQHQYLPRSVEDRGQIYRGDAKGPD